MEEFQTGCAEVNDPCTGKGTRVSQWLPLFCVWCRQVRDDTYKMVHGLQMEVQGYKLYITKESPYQQRVEFEGLQGRLREAESWLRELGALALLANFLVCQTLISVMHQEVSTFVNCTMQVWPRERGAWRGGGGRPLPRGGEEME